MLVRLPRFDSAVREGTCLMAVYLLTGKLGSGKSLAAVGRAREYGTMGRRVVSNFHIDLSSLARKRSSHLAKAFVEVIPARPSSADLHALGRGGTGEHDAGLLILDECGTFLNARQWNGEDRARIVEWFLHSRKLAWDVILIVQHASMIDKQIREAIGEFLVTVRRLDKMKLPVLSWLLPFLKLPQIHVAQVRYGLGPNDMTADHWIFRGRDLYACYSTEWISTQESSGAYCTLNAELARFRYEKQLPLAFLLSLLWRVPFFAFCLALERMGAIRRSDFLPVKNALR